MKDVISQQVKLIKYAWFTIRVSWLEISNVSGTISVPIVLVMLRVSEISHDTSIISKNVRRYVWGTQHVLYVRRLVEEGTET
jgi:hypothetical protein